jgi:AraC-like DNA-binding protein
MRMVNICDFRRRFFERLGNPWDVGLLFDYLPDTYFYAKNAKGQFVMVNQAQAARWGVANIEEIIGKTDYDFSSRDLADQYVAEDRRVMESKQPLTLQPWLVGDCRGVLRWYLSSKIPLFDRRGRVVGIAGAMRDVEKAKEWLAPYQEMESAVKYLLAHYVEKIDFRSLAKLAHLSLSQFDRRFKLLFKMTPQRFLLRVRIHAACQMLASTDKSILQIALQTGFYDQSYFTKQFLRQTGRTPTAYRRRHRHEPAAEIGDLPNG